jgi:hypothetical protein
VTVIKRLESYLYLDPRNADVLFLNMLARPTLVSIKKYVQSGNVDNNGQVNQMIVIQLTIYKPDLESTFIALPRDQDFWKLYG